MHIVERTTARVPPLLRIPLVRWLQALGISLLLMTAPAHAISPEFYQLLNELNGQLKILQGSVTRGPQCTPDLVDKVQNALQGELATSALKEVVVKPLESGAKTAASLLGAPGVALTTYGIMRCAMEESTARGFYRCALGESVGGALGAGLGEAAGDSAGAAVAGVAFDRGWDEGFAQARSAYENYGATSEEVSGTSESGDCKVRYTFHWNKRDAGRGARGGRIVFSATVSDCDCRSASEAKAGHIRAIFDVRYEKHGNSQPGWGLKPPRDIHVEAQCCGQRRYPDTSFLFNSQGKLIGKTSGDGFFEPEEPKTTGSTGGDTDTESEPSDPPTPPPPPPPIRLPAPEAVEYSRANPCPACVSIKQKIDEVARTISRLRQERGDKLDQKNEQITEKERIERRIRSLQSRLAGERGVGASSFDPATGLTTSAVDTGDGRVRITVTDREGNVVSERFRERESAEQTKAKLEQAEADLAAQDQKIAETQAEIEALDAERAEAIRQYDNLQAALDDCVEKLCRKYSHCEQLRKHIEAYERAGLTQRSASLYNELQRRAREMGCFDVARRQALFVEQTYQLDSIGVFRQQSTDQVSVKVIDVRAISGNNPFDERNPEAPDSQNALGSEAASSSGSGEDILVVQVDGRFIPIRKLSVADPDACPSPHYHASFAIACDGTGVTDPAPGTCGFGVVGSEFPIPLDSCANP